VSAASANRWGTVDKPFIYWGQAYTADPANNFQGGYGLNSYFYFNPNDPAPSPESYATDSSVRQPSQTPVFADCVWDDGGSSLTPNDPGPHNTTSGSPDYYEQDSNIIGLARFCVARHGSVPGNINSWPSGARPPGSINVEFCDVHVETVPIANLWSLPWNKDWVAPGKAQLILNWQCN
jgi:hypothetical protein